MPDGAASTPAAVGDVVESPDSHHNVLSNRACMSPHRWPPQGLVACCSSWTLSIVCVAERAPQQLGIVSDDAVIAPAAPGDVIKSRDSHAIVLSNGGCMSPQRWPPQGLVACCSSFTLSIVCVTERGIRRLGITSEDAAISPAAVGDVTKSPSSHANVLSNGRWMPPQR